jgi:hypothetical protein
MKKELMKKLYLKEVVITLLFIISTFIYLNVPYKALDLIGIKIEKLDKSITEISLYQSKDIDFISGYKKSFKATLPFSQIIEYKKERAIYNLALYNANANEIPKDFKEILSSINEYNSLKEVIGKYNNTKYTLYQFLGVITVILILTAIYFTIKFKRPDFLNYYIFIVLLFYVTNLVFLGLKSEKEMLTEKILKESFVNNKLN